jgi:hypothetical protein
MDFRNRIVGYSQDEPLDQVLFNPLNWRIHPARQQSAVRESLLKVGWVETVMVNVRSSELWTQDDRGVKILPSESEIILQVFHGTVESCCSPATRTV